jgi:hypothetical protein
MLVCGCLMTLCFAGIESDKPLSPVMRQGPKLLADNRNGQKRSQNKTFCPKMTGQKSLKPSHEKNKVTNALQ